MNSNEKEINGIEIDEETTTAEPIEEEVAEEATEAIEEEVIAEEVAAAEDIEETAEDADTEENVTFETPDDVETVGEVDDEEALEEGEAEFAEEEAPETLVADEVSKKKGNTAVIMGIVAAAVVVVVTVVILFLTGVIGGNKYNKLGYPNVSGRTIEEIAEEAGLELADFLEMYDFPEDMPGDTEEMNAIYHMPASMYLETMYGIDFATMKTALNIPDQTTPNTPKTLFDKIKAIFVKDEIQEINENTPWYIVEGELTVGDFSAGKLDEFKEFYGLGDEVTEETKIKEINDEINESIKQKLKEQEETAAEQTETENEEAPAQDANTSAETEQTEDAAQNAEENNEDKSEE